MEKLFIPAIGLSTLSAAFIKPEFDRVISKLRSSSTSVLHCQHLFSLC